MDDADAVANVLDERPELESPLKTALAIDEETDAWTFEELPVDSGAFGELVSRGLIEQVEDGEGYRVTDPRAARVALANDGRDELGTGGGSKGVSDRGPPLGGDTLAAPVYTVDLTAVTAFAGAILAVILARVYVYGSIFRDGAVVLSGNDPYHYRYWVEQVLAASGGAFNPSGLATLPRGILEGEPLFVATLWAFAVLFGGDATAAGWVLAWYPVLAAAITGGLTYLLTRAVTDDRRVALAAVLLLAITPAHAFRTSLGFADHHAFDYVWLLVTATALVRATPPFGGETGGEAGGLGTGTLRDLHRWTWAGLIAVGVVGQTLAWDAGPLFLVPLGGYVVARVFSDVRTGIRPVVTHGPTVAAIALAAGVVYAVHTVFDWHSATVAIVPVLLFLGVFVVVIAGELALRFELSVSAFASRLAALLIFGVVAVHTFVPDLSSSLVAGLQTILASRSIAETQALLDADTFGWLLLFGFVLVIAVPYLLWATVESYRGASGWYLPVVYGWYLLGLTFFQVRFAGQLSMFVAVFAGLAFVHAAHVVDLTAPPVPFADESETTPIELFEWRRVAQLAVLFALIGSLGFVQVPVKMSQVVTDGGEYRTAAWMDDYADERSWEYPDNYVFSPWGQNRMFNYFVNGESRSDDYAQENYGRFVTSGDGSQWYKRLRNQAGFVVTTPAVVSKQSQIGTRLYRNHGSGTGAVPSLDHYRLVHIEDEFKVFTLVQGAVIEDVATPNSTVTARVNVTVSGESFTYTEQAAASASGGVFFRVPYPGTYQIGDDTVVVNESAVLNGKRVLTTDVTGDMGE
ncbi:hypothetical protein [Halosimplex sp. TS25]|uniref:hypothetical protein n=1 Tax=Halosimplex rarum TaxID=3396619 RepID=UPI0039E942AA